MAQDLTITFVRKKADDKETEDISRELTLDDAMNESVYGTAKSSFLPKEIAYIRFVTDSKSAYTLKSSDGAFSKSASNILFDVVESIEFANESEAQLSYSPQSEPKWKWIGSGGYDGSVKFSGKTVMLTKPAVAIMEVTYKASGDRLALVCTKLVNVVAVVIQDGETESITVDFTSEEEAPAEKESYSLEILNLCSGLAVSDAAVYLDGTFIGSSNAKGIIDLGLLEKKSRHTLKIVKEGFVDSDKDPLDNDEFTVP